MTIITDGDFSKLMDEIYPKDSSKNIAVACSGGNDSMALALLMRNWANNTGNNIIALIVNHKLRTDSTVEAKLVQTRLKDVNITAHILTRKFDEKITSDIQNKARMLRYQLLQQWCVDNDYQTIATAHHIQDQAETFLLRLARGSGVYGLAAMPKSSIIGLKSNKFGNINLIRPLLDINKNDLIDSLANFNVKAVDDPSNKNEKFDRVKIRNNQQLLDSIGLNPQRLAKTAKNLRRARNALEEITKNTINEAVQFYPVGYCHLDKKLLLNQPEEIILRALSNIIITISGGKYPPRLSQIENLYDNLTENKTFNGCSLAGAIVAPLAFSKQNKKPNILIFYRENSAISDIKSITNKVIWDNRFLLEFNLNNQNIDKIEIRKLGDAGRVEINKDIKLPHDIPVKIMPSLPALWADKKLLSVPHINNIKHVEKFGLTNISSLIIKKL